MRLSVFPHLAQKSAILRCLLRLSVEPRGAIKESCNCNGNDELRPESGLTRYRLSLATGETSILELLESAP
jgi:hypothetical protein